MLVLYYYVTFYNNILLAKATTNGPLLVHVSSGPLIKMNRCNFDFNNLLLLMNGCRQNESQIPHNSNIIEFITHNNAVKGVLV